ncbi:PucR family transcriptional regulator [Microbacterium deminutum]|uniref:Helix-turn-helix domain-containing protein n=1 Tax=Microbacterium deminutum TaxID=344164 RepID=A0ABN2RB49_9MICO
MTQRPRASLRRVLDDLGHTLLDLAHGDVDATADVGGVVIYDALDEPVYPPRAFVLGVGVEADQVAALVRTLSEHGAVALVVRAPVDLDDQTRAAIEASGVALVGLARGATWVQLAALVRSLLADGDIGEAERESIGGLPSGDLFAVANAIAALLDAPVTIEDRSSRVLAFSGRQEEADASRAETIIGRQVPERYARILTERGIFRDLYRYDRPVIVDPVILGTEGITTQRIAIGVRAGDEVLGSVWAAMDGPLTPQRAAGLRDAAKLVALHLLRVRAGADVQRRLSTELVGTALEGGVGARDALARLGLIGHRVSVVGAALVRDPQTEPSTRAEQMLIADQQRFADALAVHLAAVRPGAAVALVGDVAYGIFPTVGDAETAEERGAAIAHDFLERVGTRMPAVVAVGPAAAEVSAIAQSRATVDRILRVLRQSGGPARVARAADVQLESLVLELRDLSASRGDGPMEPIARLISYDERHDAQLVATLRAWLETFGDVAAASASQFVHANTFRYRLRRVQEISGLDLDDSDARFAAMLQLRMLGPS